MGFYYNLLLDKIPFRDEQHLHPADGNYFVKCVRLGIFTNTPQLDVYLQAYARYNLWTNATLDKMRANISTFVDDAAAAALSLPHGDAGGDPDGPDVLAAGAAAFQCMQAEEGLDYDTEPTESNPQPGKCKFQWLLCCYVFR